MVTMWRLSSYGRNIEIQDGALLDMQFSKRDRCRLHWFFYISISFWFRWQPYSISRWRLHCRSFSVSLSIPRYMSTYHSSCRLLIPGSTKLAKCGAFRVCLETIEIHIAILSTCACYKFKASYLSDTRCGPCRYITGSVGCLPSPTSNVWKFRLYFHWLFVLWLVGWSLNMLV